MYLKFEIKWCEHFVPQKRRRVSDICVWRHMPWPPQHHFEQANNLNLIMSETSEK